MEQKRGEGKQDLKNGGQGVGALKRGGLEPPYKICSDNCQMTVKYSSAK